MKPIPNQHLEASFQVNPNSTNLVVFGVPRSASTFVWQVMSDIYEVGVIRTHVYFDAAASIPIVRTIRDWRDTIVSYWRSHNTDVRTGRHPRCMIREDLFQYTARYQNFIWTLKEWTIMHPDSPLIRYEELIANPAMLFGIAEKLGGPQVASDRRRRILEAHSVMVNRSIADNLKVQDRSTLLAPWHVHEAEVGTWRKFVPDELQEQFTSLLQSELDEWGYGEKAAPVKQPEPKVEKVKSTST